MAMKENISAVVKLYDEQLALFADRKAALKNTRNEDDRERLRGEAKAFAHKALGHANAILAELIDEQTNSTGTYKQKLQDNIDYYEKAINALKYELSQLGSALSGIPKITFDEIAGLENIKDTMRNYLFALKEPNVAKAYNIGTNIGVLLYGPPGTGKTMIAEAIATELGVRFFTVTPSMIFGPFVGQSERNVRDIFAELRACEEGSVLLIDECESIFGRRDSGESSRAAIGVANQLLQEMNGAGDGRNEKRVIIGATNCPEMIDPAYLRHKRFSLQFLVDMPNRQALETVINLRFKKIKDYIDVDYMRDVMLSTFGTDKFTCADVTGIIEQCAFLAMQEYREKGGKGPYVRINELHFRKVMSTFQRSVKDEDVLRYRSFKDQRQ